MIWTLALSFAISALATLAVIASASRHAHWSADHDLSGPQKMHAHAVPRVGGIGIAAGLIAGAGALCWHYPLMWKPLALVMLCAMPAFGFGLIEDFTKAVSPRRRLVAAAASAGMGVWLLDAVIVRSGWAFADQAMAATGLAIAMTLVAVAGVVHAVNIIDGMNGLASMSVALMMAAVCYIALQVGDGLVAGIALATLGTSLGFFIWNYPRGLIFLGDGGAYLLGFLVAELGLMLVQRNPMVSPLTPLVLVAYPVFETMFTMYRRKVLRGRPVSQPDGIHLHTLIYRRLMRWAVGSVDAAALTRGNSMTSPYLWALSSIAVLPAAIWWSNSLALTISLVVFVLVYLSLYWRIVRFRTPGWMNSRSGRGER
jgi:UDP-N-acetylmuramyl pentapeptide phosphotransferase/UDP-N-acetylglucosamine-1-phosphate transferase